MIFFSQYLAYRTTKGYPLIIEAETIRVEQSTVDRDVLDRFLQKIDYPALVQACQQLSPHVEGGLPDLPKELPEALNDSLAADLYHVLFDIHLMQGNLVCPDTGRKFPVKDGIPNMILHEDEL